MLRGPGIALDFGAVRARVRSETPTLAPAIRHIYGAFEPEACDGVFDVAATVRHVRGLRRLLRPQVELIADGERVFEPFPRAIDLPLLEWGLNYLIATRCNHRLLLHAGAVEHAGVGLLLPALPGCGKSTLTAALVCHGYRLLSDEFGVVDLADGRLQPLLRPIALKNESIDVISRLAPHAVLGPRFDGTRKGTVAHLAPPRRSVRARHLAVVPALIVFPQFERGATCRLEEVDAVRVFTKLSVNSFNYRLLGSAGFDAIGTLVRRCTARRLVFGDVVAALRLVDDLVASVGEPVAQTGTG